MLQTALPWQLHDAVIIRCGLEGNRWVVDVQLYAIFYPAKPSIRLTFSGIYNVGKVEKLHAAISEYDEEDNWNGTRINAFHYDTKQTSKEGDFYLFFHADHADPVTIHCEKLTLEEL